MPSASSPLSGRLPPTVKYIVGNEFCERFSFYGMRAILALYLKDRLGLSKNAATEAVHLFIVAAYFTPLLGAFISDSFIGKYRTIISLSIVYCFGNWTLSFAAGLAHRAAALAWTGVGLGLIALGTGGIKPCVAAFGGDQVEASMEPGPARDQLLRVFFSAFYFSINAGATLSTLVTPILRTDVSYSAAFAVPAFLMLAALMLFWLGSSQYVHRAPAGNLITEVVAIVGSAFQAQRTSRPSWTDGTSFAKPLPADDSGGELAVSIPSGRDTSGSGGGQPPELPPLLLQRRAAGAARKGLPPGAAAAGPHWLDGAKAAHGNDAVEDVKQLMRVLTLFLPMPIFWSLYDQQTSRWVFQAEQMTGALWGGLVIQPDQMQVVNSVLILIMIPLFDRVIYPAAETRGWSLRPLRRMCIGMALGALAFVLSAIVQLKVDHLAASAGGGASSSAAAAPPLSTWPGDATLASEVPGVAGLGESLCQLAGSAPCISMLWQLPQITVMTAGEIMFSITGLELAYSQAPASMTSVVQAGWTFTVALGNLFTVLVVGTLGSLLTQVEEFFAFAGGCTVAMLLLVYVGQGFQYVESVADEEAPGQCRSFQAEEEHALSTERS